MNSTKAPKATTTSREKELFFGQESLNMFVAECIIRICEIIIINLNDILINQHAYNNMQLN